jgi:putative transcription factor
MACDMCGNTTANLKAEIEGVMMDVCKNCVKYGKVQQKPRLIFTKRHSQRQKKPEFVERLVENYGHLIKSAREKRGYKQEEFARMLNERESIMQKIEAGKQRPSIALAQKLQRMLKITLIERTQMKKEENMQKSAKGPLTIGDLMQKK